ncbi:MAG: GGDEF domain-containing protein [Chrysiogenetes bacterium]|nr:GGDEF domain-containing protein [Chrysiogenetes bacterium]
MIRLTGRSGAILGLLLAQGAPVGLLVLFRVFPDAPPDYATYLYIWLGTTIVMSGLGWALGRRAQSLAEANVLLTLLARQDALTGLANARALNEELERAVAHAGRTQEPLSLVIFDLDHFKDVNDNYGHQMGDHVLKGIGMLLRKQARIDDLPARYGGEEMALVLPNTNEEQASQIAERLRTMIEAGAKDRTLAVPITASFGVAELDADEAAFHLFARADRALYLAKNAGRNCVKRASHLTDPVSDPAMGVP